MIILDFGSGNTCRNDKGIVKDMIQSLGQREGIIIKWQLFQHLPPNIP
jgi:hypothetical protein